MRDDDRKQMVYKISNLYTQHKIFPYVRYSLFNNFHLEAIRTYENYPNYTAIVTESLKQLEKRTKFPWFTKLRDHVTTMLFAEWTDLPILLEMRRKKVKALFISTLGDTHTEMLAATIDMHFHFSVDGETFNKSMMNLVPADIEKISGYDMIISDWAWQKLPKEKLFVVDSIPSVKQIAEIGNEIGRIQLIIHKAEE
jgi:hypothetical protein